MGNTIKRAGRLSILSTLLVSVGVMADQGDVFNVHADATYSHDSNLFRLDKGETAPGGAGKSDSVVVLNAGININKPYGQQRFRLDASVNRNQYNRFSFLDYDAFQYNGTWNWHVTPRFFGILKASRSEALVGFDNNDFQDQKIRTTTTNLLEADYWLAGSWHALAGYVQERHKHNILFTQDRDFQLDGWSLGGRYDPGNGHTMELRYLSRNGEYLGTANTFDQYEVEVRLSYVFSPKTRFEGAVAYVDRKHGSLSQRDYDGWRGRAGVDWNPTGKMGVRFNFERRLASWQDTYSSYFTSDSISVGPYWKLTAKQTVSASIEATRDRYEGAPAGYAGALRHDDRRAVVLGWTWEPSAVFSIGANVRREERDSNLPGFGFKDLLFGVNLRLYF